MRSIDCPKASDEELSEESLEDLKVMIVAWCERHGTHEHAVPALLFSAVDLFALDRSISIADSERILSQFMAKEAQKALTKESV